MPFQRQYDPTRKLRWVDRTGQRSGLLLYLEWVGYHRKKPCWKVRCDCGRVCIKPWDDHNYRSCGCRQIQLHDFRTLQADGTWRLERQRPVMMSDGTRFESIAAMARHVGIAEHTMRWRMHHKPESEWLKPGRPSGAGQRHRKRLKKQWHATREGRRQPWSAANLANYNATRRGNEGSS